MSTLPPLPEADHHSSEPFGLSVFPWFSADQMRAYAAAAVAAERERCAKLCEKASAEYIANATGNKFLTDYGRAIMTSASEWSETMASVLRQADSTLESSR